MRELDRLWTYIYLTKDQLRERGLYHTRHVRWDGPTGGVFYVVHRSNPTQVDSGAVEGRWAVAEDVINWMDDLVYKHKAKIGYVVLVRNPPQGGSPEIVDYWTITQMIDRLKQVEPNVGQQDGNRYWWVEADGSVYTGSGSSWRPGRPARDEDLPF